MNKYIDLDVYSSISKELKRYLDELVNAQSEVVTAESYLKFPLVGKANSVYIDKSTNRIYRWDDDNIKYYCIGADYNNIKVIRGGDAFN